MKIGGGPPFVVRQEPDHLDRRRLTVATSIVILGSIIGVIAAGFLLRSSEAGRDIGPAHAAPAPSQIGTVEATPILATQRGITLRAEQRASLDRYGWVDRDAGRAQIPIEQAMDLLVERAASNDGGTPP